MAGRSQPKPPVKKLSVGPSRVKLKLDHATNPSAMGASTESLCSLYNHPRTERLLSRDHHDGENTLW